MTLGPRQCPGGPECAGLGGEHGVVVRGLVRLPHDPAEALVRCPRPSALAIGGRLHPRPAILGSPYLVSRRQIEESPHPTWALEPTHCSRRSSLDLLGCPPVTAETRCGSPGPPHVLILAVGAPP